MAARHPDKPLVGVLTGPCGSAVARELQENGVLAFPTPERASRALSRLYRYHLWRSSL
ncbi:MAG: hypothetical protein WC541_06835 [Dehalococcoidia bacterium]